MITESKTPGTSGHVWIWSHGPTRCRCGAVSLRAPLGFGELVIAMYGRSGHFPCKCRSQLAEAAVADMGHAQRNDDSRLKSRAPSKLLAMPRPLDLRETPEVAFTDLSPRI
ncbi:hypothetical protein AXG93_1175s1490 [Marchantia polymorpha subsp. ruderalis]|uniref:Uncharacterized protein n=1 Tax=Marchantia polymorpha subsp. ruderalis TaxID=1480154 RepID=A0A176VMI1_MARPO|nr:hypothetical protein AXG93_1175s1490 [Marchantia polymorpha subsp. ruderalis]